MWKDAMQAAEFPQHGHKKIKIYLLSIHRDTTCIQLSTLCLIYTTAQSLLSGVPDFFDRNKILCGGDLSHYQVPHCIRVFFCFV